VHPSSLISFYPTYSILDEVLSFSNYKNLNIYIDLKNVFQALYLEYAVVNLVENTKKSKIVDTSMFVSLLSFLAFHKIYSIKRDININFFVFFESGRSQYHLNIDKEYKRTRKIDALYGLDEESKDLFFVIMNKNYSLMDSAFNKMPSVKVIRLFNLEADFSPYYLIRNRLVDTSPDTVHVVYSNDHDLFQCVGENSFVFSRVVRSKKLIRKGEVMKNFLKVDSEIPDIYLPFAMSIIGDVGDNVRGVKGVGNKRFVENFKDLVQIVGSLGAVYENVENSKLLFDTKSVKKPNKYMSVILQEEGDNGLVSRNLKLVSFELISRALDNPTSTEMFDRKVELYRKIVNKSVLSLKIMESVLEKSGVYIGSDDLDVLYYNSGV